MVTISHSTPAIERLLDPAEEFTTIASGFRFVEGPVWNSADRSLQFNDIQNDARWRWTEADAAVLTAKPNRIGNGMTLARDGSLLVCEHVTSSVVRELRDGHRELVAFHFEGTYLNSPNDVVERSDGTVYFSDPDYGRWDHVVGVHRRLELGFQGVFMVPPGGGETRLVVARDEFDQPNGLCFSPDESVLYIDDLHGVRAFDVAPDGGLSPGRPFHAGMGDTDIPGRGNPDGMRCDEFGNIWCTARGGIWVLAPSGDLLGIIETDETSANLTWGGDDGRTLFICMSTTVRTLRTRVGAAPLTIRSGE
ncbi:SMP-30/gluconolactonase/LRE family protein [Lacisediminihabitans profunda]|nr:SMP-30/gluconolactonase/LRE family protein [Lacisediminihabitans profunda]